jgi:hypothetical protein
MTVMLVLLTPVFILRNITLIAAMLTILVLSVVQQPSVLARRPASRLALTAFMVPVSLLAKIRASLIVPEKPAVLMVAAELAAAVAPGKPVILQASA